MTRRVLIVDGGSGAGKTTFAAGLAERARQQGRRVELVSLDSFYPGWSGLAAASRMVVADVLGRGGYRRWDWDAGRPAEWVGLDPCADLVIEGCGALTPASRASADRAYWLRRGAEERRRLAIARDGEAFARWWDHWAAQEAEHWRLHRPWELADEVVDLGGPD